MKRKRQITIAAHPTSYKGITFRSKLEVKWAYLLDCLGIQWKYESKFYQLAPNKKFPNGIRYVPDFELINNIVEIKPNDPTREELFKAFTALTYSHKPFIFLCAAPSISHSALVITEKDGNDVEFGIIPSYTALGVTEKAFNDAVLLTQQMTFTRIVK